MKFVLVKDVLVNVSKVIDVTCRHGWENDLICNDRNPSVCIAIKGCQPDIPEAGYEHVHPGYAHKVAEIEIIFDEGITLKEKQEKMMAAYKEILSHFQVH